MCECQPKSLPCDIELVYHFYNYDIQKVYHPSVWCQKNLKLALHRCVNLGGGEAQVDFGAADFYENGRRISGKYLQVSFPYSNKGYMQLFHGENMECLLEGVYTGTVEP
jgi:hypothetical protein